MRTADEVRRTARADARRSARPQPHPRIARRKEEVARASGQRRVLKLTAALCVPAVVATVFVLLHTSLFAVDHVAITGASATSRGAIVRAAGLSPRPPLIDVNPIAAEQHIEALPWIASATVTRHWPRSVSIAVTERTPVAQASLSGHEVELYDATGRALAMRGAPVPGLVRIRESGGGLTPGSNATGSLQREIALVDALPERLVPKVRLIEDVPRTGLVAQLPGAVSAIFGGTDALSKKAAALWTLIVRHVSFSHVHTIDLTVPSSPVLSAR